MDPGVLLRAQAILAHWAHRLPAEQPPSVAPPFGDTPAEDISNLDSARFRTTLAAFQAWYARTRPGPITIARTDGVLDPTTFAALNDWIEREAKTPGAQNDKPSAGTVNTTTWTPGTEEPAQRPALGAAPLIIGLPLALLATDLFG